MEVVEFGLLCKKSSRLICIKTITPKIIDNRINIPPKGV